MFQQWQEFDVHMPQAATDVKCASAYIMVLTSSDLTTGWNFHPCTGCWIRLDCRNRSKGEYWLQGTTSDISKHLQTQLGRLPKIFQDDLSAFCCFTSLHGQCWGIWGERRKGQEKHVMCCFQLMVFGVCRCQSFPLFSRFYLPIVRTERHTSSAYRAFCLSAPEHSNVNSQDEPLYERWCSKNLKKSKSRCKFVENATNSLVLSRIFSHSLNFEY